MDIEGGEALLDKIAPPLDPVVRPVPLGLGDAGDRRLVGSFDTAVLHAVRVGVERTFVLEAKQRLSQPGHQLVHIPGDHLFGGGSGGRRPSPRWHAGRERLPAAAGPPDALSGSVRRH
jgi:hypothetical protein